MLFIFNNRSFLSWADMPGSPRPPPSSFFFFCHFSVSALMPVLFFVLSHSLEGNAFTTSLPKPPFFSISRVTLNKKPCLLFLCRQPGLLQLQNLLSLLSQARFTRRCCRPDAAGVSLLTRSSYLGLISH